MQQVEDLSLLGEKKKKSFISLTVPRLLEKLKLGTHYGKILFGLVLHKKCSSRVQVPNLIPEEPRCSVHFSVFPALRKRRELAD